MNFGTASGQGFVARQSGSAGRGNYWARANCWAKPRQDQLLPQGRLLRQQGVAPDIQTTVGAQGAITAEEVLALGCVAHEPIPEPGGHRENVGTLRAIWVQPWKYGVQVEVPAWAPYFLMPTRHDSLGVHFLDQPFDSSALTVMCLTNATFGPRLDGRSHLGQKKSRRLRPPPE